MGTSDTRTTGYNGLLETHWHKQACFPYPEEYKPEDCTVELLPTAQF